MRYFDLHCDTLSECALRNLPLSNNSGLHLSLERGRGLSPWVQCFAAWIPDDCREPLAHFQKIAQRFRQELLDNPGRLCQCSSREELEQAAKAGLCGAIFTVEGGSVLEGRLENLELLCGYGVRMMTLTWNGANQIGGGALEPGGLTEFGRKVLHRMEEMRMLPDVSHASEALFWDVAEATKGPLVASHSNSQAVCRHPRNLTDRQFSEILRRDGLVGLNFYPAFLAESGQAGLEDILRHAEHFLELGGEKHLALGSDFDGADMPDGMEGIQSVEKLAEVFLRHGYSDELVDRIFYQNAQEFFGKYL